MAGILVLAGFTDGWARTAFLFYDTNYAGLDWPVLDGMRIRFLVMCVGLVGTLSVLALVPRREGWYSTDGRGHPGRLPLPRLRGPVRRVGRLHRLDRRAR